MKIFHDEDKKLFYIKDEDNNGKTIGRMSYRNVLLLNFFLINIQRNIKILLKHNL